MVTTIKECTCIVLNELVLRKRFNEFASVKKLSTNLQTIPIRILDNYLRFFYSDLKTKEGKYYTLTSLIYFRAAIRSMFPSNTRGFRHN